MHIDSVLKPQSLFCSEVTLLRKKRENVKGKSEKWMASSKLPSRVWNFLDLILRPCARSTEGFLPLSPPSVSENPSRKYFSSNLVWIYPPRAKSQTGPSPWLSSAGCGTGQPEAGVSVVEWMEKLKG